MTKIIISAVINMLISAFSGFDNAVNNACDLMTGGGSLGFDMSSVWNSVLGMSNALKPFCYIVIGICLLIEMAEVASKVDIIRWEHGLKLAVKMVLSKVMIDIAPTFLKACFNQATIWISSLSVNHVSIGANLSMQLQSAVQGAGLKGLGTALVLLLAASSLSLMINLCGIFIEAIAFGRMFEIYVLLMVSPLPCAFFPLGGDGTGGGFSRITKKFFLNFIAVCLQGVMIFVCIQVFNLIMSGSISSLAVSSSDGITSVLNFCYVMAMAGIVLVVACAKCGSWARQILDA